MLWKTFAFADEAATDLDGQIAALVRNGLHGLEIRGVDGENIVNISVEKAKEIRRKLDAQGLSVWSIGSPIGKIGVNDDFAPHKEQFLHTLELADILGASHYRLFSFYIPSGVSPTDCRDEVIDRLGILCELGKQSGLVLCHENEKGIYGDNAARCADLLSALPALKAVFDPANFIQCGQDVREAWQLLRKRAAYLHIKDALPDGKVVPAGCGVGYLADILPDFAALGGDALTIEPHLTVFSGLKDLECDGETSAKMDTFAYPDNNAAFDAACAALKKLL
ncbi:MAG: sugar phosphate isomerase/epimerase [Ruminococcaceae bacterium]|nr:sugar phosphate isomerase/epimerase [Oscillospiraceae bacterium]